VDGWRRTRGESCARCGAELKRQHEQRRGPVILLVRPDHLGDVLLTLPAVLYLKRSIPAARLTYVVASEVADIPARCPAVDRAVGLPFPDPEANGVDESLWQAAAAARPALSRSDAALLLRPNDPVGGQIAARLGIPTRIGFPQPGTRPWLTHPVSEPRGHHAALGYRLVDELLRHLGRASPKRPDGASWDAVVDDAEGAEMLIETEADAEEAVRVLAAVEDAASKTPIVVHPGSGWILKDWGADRWGRVAAALFGRDGRVPVVTGSEAEIDLCNAVVSAAGRRAVSIAGRLSLGGFAALLRRSRALVAVDSGPLHLAAVVGCPVVGLYGPVTERDAGPLCRPSRRRTIGFQLPCRPCGQMVNPPCGAARYPSCITGITPEVVIEVVDELLATTADR
jgi:heptosyltransferase-3